MIRVITVQLLGAPVITFQCQSLLSLDLGLPCRSADAWNTIGVLEHELDLLKGLASGLREQEGSVDEHCQIEDTKDDVDLPADVDESFRNESS